MKSYHIACHIKDFIVPLHFLATAHPVKKNKHIITITIRTFLNVIILKS